MSIIALTFILASLTELSNIVEGGTCPYAHGIDDCKDATTTLYDLCGLESVYAWYTGPSYDATDNIWYDNSGNCRNVDPQYIRGTITPYNDFNGQTYLTGTIATNIDFPYDVLPLTYSLFYVARQFDGQEGLFIQAYDYVWFSGFNGGCNGCTQHENYITSSAEDLYGRDWFIGTDLRDSYRTNGIDRTSTPQTDLTDKTHQYRLGLNTGYFSSANTYGSDWAAAEIIVFDFELETKQQKCVEQYLADKYDLSNHASESKTKSEFVLDLEAECELQNEDEIFALYDGSSFSANDNTWYDLSGNGRNIDDYMIDGEITVHETLAGLNNETYLSGTTATKIKFPVEILPKDYTLFHVAKYMDGGQRKCIFGAENYAWLSGFWDGKNGVAHHQVWLTPASPSVHGVSDWVISTDQRDIYRSNGVSRMNRGVSAPVAYSENLYRLCINRGNYRSYLSDFAVSEVIVFNRELTPKKYKCVEKYLSNKYDINIQQTPTKYSKTDDFDSCNLDPKNTLLAWYNGSTYSATDDVWYDKSGNGYNIDSQYMSGTITVVDDPLQLNGNTHLSGTTSTYVTWPSQVLPLTYTLLHVTKYNTGTNRRILQSDDYSFVSGHYGGYSGRSYHTGTWLTNTYLDASKKYDWLLSTDQRHLYRAQGLNRNVYKEATGYSNNRYKLTINRGAAGSETSHWSMAELIAFNGELEPNDYKCIERILSEKYDLDTSIANCSDTSIKNTNNLENQCKLRNPIYAWYKGDKFDATNNILYDDSIYCRNVDGVDALIRNVFPKNDLNGHEYLSASWGTNRGYIIFPEDVLPKTYTLFHVARYATPSYHNTIIQGAAPGGFISGFYNGDKTGVAVHTRWITSTTTNHHGTNWVISTDMRSLYRSNGISRTTESQLESQKVNQYRLNINAGAYTGSDWDLAEVLVFDYELEADEYQCIEQYLSDKYSIIIKPAEDCNNINNKDLNVLKECEVEDDIMAWYDGESFALDDTIWYDKSGHCRNVEREFVSGTVNVVLDSNINHKKHLSGTTSTSMQFPFDVLPVDYTFFHVAKWDSANYGRIFQAFDYAWFSGFSQTYNDAPTAYHEGWITSYPPNVNGFYADWIISTDQRDTYRADGISKMTQDQVASANSHRYRLGLNTGEYTGSTFDCDWSVAEVMVFDKELIPKKYKCIENYLALKYDRCLATESPTSEPTNTPTAKPTDSNCLTEEDIELRQSECDVHVDLSDDLYSKCGFSANNKDGNGIYAWYDGSSYNKYINEWFDKSGNCRNVINSFIEGDITVYDNLNNHLYLTGTTKTTIKFPHDVLPIDYTLFYIARWFDGVTEEIFQAFDYQWISGFGDGLSGYAWHEQNMMTYRNYHGYEWLIGSDQRSLFRVDGKEKTTSSQHATYKDNRYRLAINDGKMCDTEACASDWAVGEVIVFDRELEMNQIKCVEEYISDKYDEPIYPSKCIKENNSEIMKLMNQCSFDIDDLNVWYDGASFDTDTMVWQDKSGKCWNVDANYIDGDVIVNNDINSNNKKYITGSTLTTIKFPVNALKSSDYTFIHVAKYNGEKKQRIFQSDKTNFFASGFAGGSSGIAYHYETWITKASGTVDYHGDNWVISTDLQNVYRSNGESRTVTFQKKIVPHGQYELIINPTNYKSDFAVAEVLIFNKELNAKKYKCIEEYLSDKYTIPIKKPTQCLNSANSNIDCNIFNTIQPFAHYDGNSFNSDDNTWYDKSGHCRNVESQSIGGTINIISGLNNNKYLSGSTTANIQFPYEILPVGYTLFHVARWPNTNTGRIFNGLEFTNFWSGFNEHYHNDNAAVHYNWITDIPSTATPSNNWVISTDQSNIYRANGVPKMGKNGPYMDQDRGHADDQWKIGINYNGYLGHWEVAEVIIYDDELTPTEYKCVEEYLSNKYNIDISESSQCKPNNNKLKKTCGLTKEPFAIYSGSSYDSIQNTWYDESNFCRNIDSKYIWGEELKCITNDKYNKMNDNPYVTGTQASYIDFPFDILPKDYTFFHLTRWIQDAGAGDQNMIYYSYDYPYSSGFWSSKTGVTYHAGEWITSSASVDNYGTEWFLSTDSRSLYRSNGIDRTIQPQSMYSTYYGEVRKDHLYRLQINNGWYVRCSGCSVHRTDFAIGEIMIFDYELSRNEYQCIEEYFENKYDISQTIPQQKLNIYQFEEIDNNNNIPLKLSEQCSDIDFNELYAWYTGDTFVIDEYNYYNPYIWYDQSGYGRNIANNHIKGTIEINLSDNNNKYISGTTTTKIEFPYDLLPHNYTLFHVSKYHENGIKNHIIQSRSEYAWFSGFEAGYSHSAYHGNIWITPQNDKDYYLNEEWVISTDQRNIFRANGVDKSIQDQPQSHNKYRYRMSINIGWYDSHSPVGGSDFDISEVLVFNKELSIHNYKCVEEYLALKYNLCLDNIPNRNELIPTQSPTQQIITNNPTTNNPTIIPTNSPTNNQSKCEDMTENIIINDLLYDIDTGIDVVNQAIKNQLVHCQSTVLKKSINLNYFKADIDLGYLCKDLFDPIMSNLDEIVEVHSIEDYNYTLLLADLNDFSAKQKKSNINNNKFSINNDANNFISNIKIPNQFYIMFIIYTFVIIVFTTIVNYCCFINKKERKYQKIDFVEDNVHNDV